MSDELTESDESDGSELLDRQSYCATQLHRKTTRKHNFPNFLVDMYCVVLAARDKHSERQLMRSCDVLLRTGWQRTGVQLSTSKRSLLMLIISSSSSSHAPCLASARDIMTRSQD